MVCKHHLLSGVGVFATARRLQAKRKKKSQMTGKCTTTWVVWRRSIAKSKPRATKVVIQWVRHFIFEAVIKQLKSWLSWFWFEITFDRERWSQVLPSYIIMYSYAHSMHAHMYRPWCAFALALAIRRRRGPPDLHTSMHDRFFFHSIARVWVRQVWRRKLPLYEAERNLKVYENLTSDL